MQINGYEMLALTINIIDMSEILNSSYMRSLHVTLKNYLHKISFVCKHLLPNTYKSSIERSNTTFFLW